MSIGKINSILFIVVLITAGNLHAQLVDKTPAAIPNAPAIYNTEP